MSSSYPSVVGAALDRRAFVKTLSAAGLGLAVAGPAVFAQVGGGSPTRRKRYAVVGTGHRHRMYRDAIELSYREHAELVGVCDVNPGRVALTRRRSVANGATPPAGYAAVDFEKMIAETKPDYVIVTTVDGTHDDYIVRALEAGCDVITEKPMTTTGEKAKRIVDAVERTGKRVRVTFNYRYSPPRTQVKDILMSGEIGEVLSVDFHWMLNTHHGTDYFRRWHGHKKNSGGLMIHKATHHFDLVNWWLGSVPASVFAMGKREFYTPDMARRLGLSGPHERCRTCPESAKCGFYLDLKKDESLRALYLENEAHDGYFRDRCVFRPEIDIEDTMNVLVRYENNVTLAYSLNAFNSWEGYQIVFNGTQGRLEHSIVERIYISGTDAVQGGIADNGVKTRIIPLRGPAREVTPWRGEGGHGGGDKAMLDDIFLTTPPADKYLRDADHRAGAYAMLIGAAANTCFVTGQPVQIEGLVPGLKRPDYAPMPSRTGPLQMPAEAKEARGG